MKRPLTTDWEQAMEGFADRWRQELRLRQAYSGDPDPGGTRLLAKVVKELDEVIQEARRGIAHTYRGL